MRYQLYPTVKQERELLDYCAQSRFMWNLGLEQRNYYRPELGPTPNFGGQCLQLTEIRQSDEWLNSGIAVSQQQALKDLDQAFQNWWKNPQHFGRPTWRKKHQHEGFRIVDKNIQVKRLSRKRGQVKVPKLGWIDFKWSRKPVRDLRSFRIKRDSANRWWLSFAIVPPKIVVPGNGHSVGIDRGVALSYVTSDGEVTQIPDVPTGEKRSILRLQRKLARQEKGSNNRDKTKVKIARLKHKQINRKKDIIEKLTTELARNNDFVIIENLKTVNMTRSAKGTIENPNKNVAQKRGLNREILKQGWGLFAKRLEDKIEEGRLIKINPAYTSQACNSCGHIHSDNRKNQALFECQECGHTDNADYNAALNILAAGHVVLASGDTPLGESVKQEPLKKVLT